MSTRNIIPQETHSEAMIAAGFFVSDLFITFILWFVLDTFKPLVHPALQIFYTGFTVLLGLVLTRKAFRSERKNYASLVIAMSKDQKTYHARNE